MESSIEKKNGRKEAAGTPAEAGGQERTLSKNRYPLIELCAYHESNEIRQRQVCRQLVMTCRSIHVHCVFHGLSPENDLANFTFYRFSL